MKCPYRDFESCLVQKCPSCNYKENKTTHTEGRYPYYMSAKDAIEKGYAWEETKTTYEFISCKLIDNNVQPVPSKKEIINNTNTTKTSVVISKRLF